MSAKSRRNERLKSVLAAEESVIFATPSGIQKVMTKQVGTRLAKGMAASLAVTAATGGAAGLLVVSLPPTVWVVVTSKRLLVFTLLKGGKEVGNLVFNAPREALSAALKTGFMNSVAITDAQDGRSLMRLRFGVRRKSAANVAAAIDS